MTANSPDGSAAQTVAVIVSRTTKARATLATLFIQLSFGE
jgi:hypothetical protein